MKIVQLMKKNKFIRTITFLSVFAIIYGILLTSLDMRQYSLKEGDIAKSDIKATRDVTDAAATEERKKQAVDSVGIQYTKKSEVASDIVEDINNDFTNINKIKDENINDNQKMSQLKSSLKSDIGDKNISTILQTNKDDLKTLQQFIIKTMKDTYNGDIREDSTADAKRAKNNIEAQFSNEKFSGSITDLGIAIANSYVQPNMFLDFKKTKEVKNEVAKNVENVVIKKDQLIVREGEPVTKNEISILQDLGLLNNSGLSNWYMYIMLAVMTAVVLFLQLYYINRYYKDIYKQTNKIIMLCILNIFTIVLARSIEIISPFLVPFACAPMLMILLMDSRIALFEGVLNCVFISVACRFNIEVTIVAIMSALIACTTLKKMKQRNDTIYAALFIAIINAIMAFSIGFLLSSNLFDNFKKAAFVFIGGIMSAILTIGFLPIFESIFDVVTDVKLLELSDPNHPLIKKLLMEAPGTYHHSIIVANIAEAAVEQVGGNALLTRVSAYYHDIGKLKRPYFFKENQIGIKNPHDKINPNLSALVIISHVKDGVDIAKEYKLPQIIQDAIQQHHGTTLVKYFYLTLKNASDNPDEIKEENFRYPGPIPRSKEVAIIMLADSVEAAVRSIQEPTQCKIEEMINNIIEARLSDGQLNQCELTMRDIQKIRKAFLKSLLGIYHQRIEYPTDNKKLKQKRLEEGKDKISEDKNAIKVKGARL
ncbi:MULTISPECIES: HD family phosphohydrolase [Clostridium]|uniref:HD family phosphohydrolase n=1 Tax=Clostridium TaxID=1485 RepID=UPI00082692BA|nr:MULTISPECIES: HD family phosphohydrolase [Clostridium]PJI07077.1 phosphohydrolase [Clostridium sp. CT7]